MLRFVLVFADGHTETREKVQGCEYIEGDRHFVSHGLARARMPTVRDGPCPDDITRVFVETPKELCERSRL